MPLACSYEPELFPGLIYRMVKPRIVLLIFVSGKVVLTGTVTLSHARAALLPVSGLSDASSLLWFPWERLLD